MENIVKSQEYDYIGRKKIIDEICNQYPFVKKSIIGRSCGGNDIVALKIGSSPDYSLISAGFHGSERITSVILLMFIYDLVKAIGTKGFMEGLDIKKAMTGRGIIFVPTVNPDGCEISLKGEIAFPERKKQIARMARGDIRKWNANLRGVDINHNFDAGWQALKEKELKEGIFGPRSTRFGGYSPESEPETNAMVNLCKNNTIRQVVCLHTQGEVIYWTYGDNKPRRSKKMAEIMATSSGYALDVPIGISTGGGFKDWFIENFNKPGFTVELGLGENPLPSQSAETIYKKVREMLILSCIM